MVTAFDFSFLLNIESKIQPINEIMNATTGTIPTPNSFFLIYV